MNIELLSIDFYGHFKSIGVLGVEYGLNVWKGHLLYLSYDGDTFMWDLFYMNADKHGVAG